MTESRCYICFEADGVRPLISPCACNSSVHSFCIERFEYINKNVSQGVCSICHKEYTLVNYGIIHNTYRRLLFMGNDKIYISVSVVYLILLKLFLSLMNAVLSRYTIITIYALMLGMFIGGVIVLNYTIIKNTIISNIINNLVDREYNFLRNNIPEMVVFVSTIVFPLWYAVAFSTLTHLKYALVFNHFITASFALWAIAMGKINRRQLSFTTTYPKYAASAARRPGLRPGPKIGISKVRCDPS